VSECSLSKSDERIPTSCAWSPTIPSPFARLSTHGPLRSRSPTHGSRSPNPPVPLPKAWIPLLALRYPLPNPRVTLPKPPVRSPSPRSRSPTHGFRSPRNRPLPKASEPCGAAPWLGERIRGQRRGLGSADETCVRESAVPLEGLIDPQGPALSTGRELGDGSGGCRHMVWL